MTIEFSCSGCGSQLKVKDDAAGKRARCRCGTVVAVPIPVQPSHIVSEPVVVSQPVAPQLTPVQCPGCRRIHQVSNEMLGTVARCSCGKTIRVPTGAGDFGPRGQSDALFDDLASLEASAPVAFQQAAMPQQPYGAAQGYPASTTASAPAGRPATYGGSPPTKSDDEVLASYLGADWKSQADQPAEEEGESLEASIMNGGVLAGGAAMAVAVIWFFVAWEAAGVIFIYPPILFVVGLIGFLRGLIS